MAINSPLSRLQVIAVLLANFKSMTDICAMFGREPKHILLSLSPPLPTPADDV
jgi:hypothetical protein